MTDAAQYYLSDTVAGATTTTPPTAVGSVIKPVLIAIGTTAAQIVEYPGAQVQAANANSGYSGYSGIATSGYSGFSGNSTSGYSGINGSTGAQGATGSTGAQGTSGYSGLKGSTGSTGAQGAQGAQGFQGATGNTGAQGASGYSGINGSTGAQGAQGAQGSTGVTPGGTTNYVAKFTGATTIANSLTYDNGTSVGVNTTAPSATLTISGTLSSSQSFWVGPNFYVTTAGNATGVSFTSTSSKLGKTNIRPLTTFIVDPITTTQLLSAVVYDSLLDGSADEIGFIAEDVLPVLPAVVTTENDKVIGIDYSRLTALLTEAIKAQQVQINNLNNLIIQLSARLS